MVYSSSHSDQIPISNEIKSQMALSELPDGLSPTFKPHPPFLEWLSIQLGPPHPRTVYLLRAWWLTYPSEKYESLKSVGMMTFPTEWKVIKFHGSKPTRIGLESGLHWLCPPVGARIARPGCLGPYLSWRPFRILDVCPPVFSNVAGQLLCHGALQLERAMVDCPLLIEG